MPALPLRKPVTRTAVLQPSSNPPSKPIMQPAPPGKALAVLCPSILCCPTLLHWRRLKTILIVASFDFIVAEGVALLFVAVAGDPVFGHGETAEGVDVFGHEIDACAWLGGGDVVEIFTAWC